MADDATSIACATEFAGDRNAMAEVMAARLEGFAPLNISNMDINEEAPNQHHELDPALVRAPGLFMSTMSIDEYLELPNVNFGL